MFKLNRNIALAGLLIVCGAFAGCQREDIPAASDNAGKTCYFGTDIIGAGPETRSLLIASDIETKVTGVTLAAYKGGSLYKAEHFTSSFNAMPMVMMEDDTYNVYAFVNMGDLTGALPSSEGALSSVSYDVPSYSTVNTRGIPMSGVNASFIPKEENESVISVRRLFAKVTMNLSCDWAGASIDEVRIYNMNGSLPLYGSAKASNASKILSFQDIATGSGLEGEYVFYVPENMQGTISGIEDSSGKSHEANNGVAAKQSVLTYMEAKVSVSGLYTGTMYFRSYLGDNATDNFDIEGNRSYDWTVSFHEEGLSLTTWKASGNAVTDHRYITMEEEVEIVPGETIPYSAFIDSNISELYVYVSKDGSIYSDYGIKTQTGILCSADAAVGAFFYVVAQPAHNVSDDLVQSTLFTIVEEH